MPWNPEYYMKKDEVVKILEDNKITNIMKKQNPIAKEVRTPKYKQRIVKDKTIYDRKNIPSDEEEGDRMKLGDHLHEIEAVEKF